MGASVVSGSDASPVLETAEGVLDAMALPVEVRIVLDDHLAALSRGDARADASLGQRLAKPVRIVAPVSQQRASLGDGRQHGAGARIVGGLARGQEQADRPTSGIGDRMQLGIQAALGAPDEALGAPF